MILEVLGDDNTSTISQAIKGIGSQLPSRPPVSLQPPPPVSLAPMQTNDVFSPMPGQQRKCSSCGGRGDVNVNVNVDSSNNKHQQSETPVVAPVDRTTNTQHNNQAPSFSGNQVQQLTITPQQVREVVSQELNKMEKPVFEQPKPQVIMVPQDRIVEKIVYKPFAAVAERIKKVFVNRDVNHPIDRVKKVIQPLVKPTMEGGVHPKR